ncbi:lipase 1 [Lentzea sp. NBRC 105346]|uniref:SGNH/GDSL hydrolase family protein n=1 Tax=Lentzea sp. NBRC 105346 TaxID=3032205 RepID=UPI0024A07C2F|nr:SGNH/GDSL hydrolase family protein [Lentzea sp. NBRC 105346]GLZ32342.1 lipase 1 [Lentzea sp. NBRC 105346]
MTLFAAAVLVGALLTPVAPEYVALGDSYASGVGAGGTHGECRRTENAYPALYGKAFPSFRFAACTGATTADVIANQVGELTPATTLVTITVGGNDLGFTDVMTTCVLNGERSCLKAVAKAVEFVGSGLPPRLDTTYAAIRERAPRAKLVVVGYPRLFENTPRCPALNAAKRAALNGAADRLSEVTAARAAAAGAVYVDGRTVFAGHGVCAADPWINGLTRPVANSYHPNRKGQQGYFEALTAATS